MMDWKPDYRIVLFPLFPQMEILIFLEMESGKLFQITTLHAPVQKKLLRRIANNTRSVLKMESGIFILMKFASIHSMKYSDYLMELHILKMFHSVNSSMFRLRLMKQPRISVKYWRKLSLRTPTGFVLKTQRNRRKFAMEERNFVSRNQYLI